MAVCSILHTCQQPVWPNSLMSRGVHIHLQIHCIFLSNQVSQEQIPPQHPEKIWHQSSDPQKVLQLHHREYPECLHHCLVWQLLSLRPQGTIEGSAYGPVHHRGQASGHPGPLYHSVSEEGPKNCQRLQPPQSQTVFSATARQAVLECHVQVQEASEQLLPPSHKTPEQLIKWLPKLFGLPPPSMLLLLAGTIYAQSL